MTVKAGWGTRMLAALVVGVFLLGVSCLLQLAVYGHLKWVGFIP